MGNLQDKDKVEIIGQTSLMNALYVQRMSYKYFLSQSMIYRNYLKINTSFKNHQDSLKFVKTSMKKLSDVRQSLLKVKIGQKPELDNSKFTEKLENFQSKKFNFIENENPEILIDTEKSQNEEMRTHLSDLQKYIEHLNEVIGENNMKIEENNQKAFQVSELVNEVADMKHYHNFISVHHRYLGKKNQNRMKGRRCSSIVDSYRKSHGLELLKISKGKEKTLRKKLKDLTEKVENKFKEHSRVWESIKKQTEATEEQENLERKLELLIMKEEKIKEKISILKRSKHISSVSTYDGPNESSQLMTIDKRIENLTDYLTNVKNKRYHLSEIPLEDIENS